MVEVFFEVPTGKEKSDKNSCIELFFDIQDGIKNKIRELEKTQGKNDIDKKCQEIDKYLQEQKDSHNECYQDSIKSFVTYIDQETRNILSKYSKYSQYCKCLTSTIEECTKPNVETEELGKENGNPVSERLTVENSNQTASICNGKPCIIRYSENQELPVTNHTSSHEHSTDSAKITSKPSEGINVMVNPPSAVSSACEVYRDYSDTSKGTGCPSKDMSSSGHSTSEGSEAHPTIPSSVSDSVNKYNSTYISQEYVAGLININSKTHNSENTQCEVTNDQHTTDGSEYTVIIKLRDCKSENITYTILENSNNKSLHPCNNTNCGESHLHINEDGSNNPNREDQQNNAITRNSLGKGLNSGNGIVSSGDSVLEETDTIPEKPPLKMYITIIAMILGGIFLFAFLL
ncbi:hypothetical protein PCYB_002540 [Plasmodium cynomolgi strain B]|uniref:Uncharacterized protein n=1 Tax=Plasmodium cynomolgi (strain B) TaxID=1120755 RepID=K6V2M9_PLACD|nr:hypothetical protein PCYB_002540 [Plasmodium cynomolgi strain B]GAB69505.1 hypothetical protein PCYB_002540 [Plasmodium cynomolgi strain B]